MGLVNKGYGKKIIVFMLCFCFILWNLEIIYGEETSGNRTVKAGIFFFEGYHMEDGEGNLIGYGIEFLNLVSEYSHLNFEYVGYDKSWGDMLNMLDEGLIDVVTSARLTPEREEKYAFSLPIGRNNTVLSVRADKNLHTGDYKAYDGMKIGILKGSSQNQSLVKFAKQKGFSYVTKQFSDSDDLAAALQRGTIDAILSSNLRKTENERILDTIESDNFYAIVRKEDTDLLEEINYAIEQMNINEGDWSNVMFYQYYGPINSNVLNFTQREQDYIRDVVSGKKSITVTAIGDRNPYSYVKDGELKGILPDYFAHVMEIAGLPYEVVVPENKEDYYRLADNNGVDVVIDHRNLGTEAPRGQYQGFCTDAYMTTGVAKVTRKDLIGEVSRVAITDAQGEDSIERILAGDAELISYPTREEALEAVLRGIVDAAYVHTYVAQLFVNNDLSDSMHFSVENNVRYSFRMYIRNSSDHELVTILNKCIHQMPNDALSQLITEYTSYTPEEMTFKRYMLAHPRLLAVTILVASFGVGLILLLYFRTRWNKKIIEATGQANKELEEQLSIVDALSRDYLNVFAVDEGREVARVVKMKGYVIAGFEDDEKEEMPYNTFLNRYIEGRVYSEDQSYLEEALALDKVKEKLQNDVEYVGSYRGMIGEEIHMFQFTYVKVEGRNHKEGSFILAGFRNIDEMVRQQQEQQEVLSVALAEANRANNAKTTFLNNMSHDIRTPMNAIIGFTSLASTHIKNEILVQDYLSKIMTSSSHLLSLINDVLDMSRIESGKVKLEEHEASLKEILEDLKTIVQSDVKAKDLDFSMDIQKIRDDRVICDKLRLNQVLLNVLSNAIKYTKSGGKIDLIVSQIEDMPGDVSSYRFQVRDTGIGMSKEFLNHLFEPFEREQTATVSGIQGTGLGLAITKNIVDVMNGTITVTSQEGKGSEFVIEFQFKAVRDLQPENSEDELYGVNGQEVQDSQDAPDDMKLLQGKRILLVEDNELNQEIAITILEEAGFIIETADDGIVAVDIMEKREAGTFDMILMDIQMPIMDGYNATRAIRAMDDPDKASIPIVAMTANAFDEDRQKAAEAGMNDHIAKPIDIEKLMGTLKRILLNEE